MCADSFACALVNTEAHQSVPLTRMYDVALLWRELAPLVQKESGFSWFTAAKVKRVRTLCVCVCVCVYVCVLMV